MRVSIIIVNYNGGKKLTACLESLLATGTPSEGVEIILWDNSSTDDSMQGIESRFPWVRVHRSSDNLGFAGGNNRAVALATGQTLVFLNPDTVVYNGWLDPLVNGFDDDPRVGMITSKLLMPDGRINACGNDVHLTGLTLCRGMGRPETEYNEPATVSAVSGAAFSMRRDLFLALGGFDEDMFLYMEDTDLSWRVQLSGYICRYDPRSRVMHDYALRFGPRKVFYQERNRYQMLLKCLKWRTLIVLIPALVLAEIISWGFVITRDIKNWTNKPQAYAWILGHWGDLLNKRRSVQHLRRMTDRDLLSQTRSEIAFGQVEQNILGKLANGVFNPLFTMLRAISLFTVRW